MYFTTPRMSTNRKKLEKERKLQAKKDKAYNDVYTRETWGKCGSTCTDEQYKAARKKATTAKNKVKKLHASLRF